LCRSQRTGPHQSHQGPGHGLQSQRQPDLIHSPGVVLHGKYTHEPHYHHRNHDQLIQRNQGGGLACILFCLASCSGHPEVRPHGNRGNQNRGAPKRGCPGTGGARQGQVRRRDLRNFLKGSKPRPVTRKFVAQVESGDNCDHKHQKSLHDGNPAH